MRRLFWRLAYFPCKFLHCFGLDYKWVNVGCAAWHRNSFDPLWHYRWFGDRIDKIPDTVNICGIRYHTTVTDGLVQFSERHFSYCSMSFLRDPYDPHAMLWYTTISKTTPASHIVTAYQWVEAVFGGSFEFKRQPV